LLGTCHYMTIHQAKIDLDSPTQPVTPVWGDGLVFDDNRVAHWGDLELSEVAVARLRARRTHDEPTIAVLVGLATEICETRNESGPLAALTAFFGAATCYEDALDRLAAMHTIEFLEQRQPLNGQQQGLRPAAFPGWVNPVDPHRVKRVLRPLELSLLRLVALSHKLQQVAIIAFGEAGAAVGELPQIPVSTINQGSYEVILPGGVDGLAERIAALPHWAGQHVETLATHLAAGLDADSTLLVYGGASQDPSKIQSAIAMNATNLFRRIGLGGDASVSFGSLRNTAARNVYTVAGTDAAVEFLGVSSYDLCRQHIGLTRTPQRRERIRN
jgi:hypothetical protein